MSNAQLRTLAALALELLRLPTAQQRLHSRLLLHQSTAFRDPSISR